MVDATAHARETHGSPDWWPIAALLLVAGWGANQFVALLPLYRSELRLSAPQSAVVFGLYALGVVPGLLGGGPLSDRFGRRGVATFAMVLALAGNLTLAGLGSGFGLLLLGRFLVGLGSGATFSAGSAWLVDLDLRASALRATASMAGGFGAGPLIAGLLAVAVPNPLRVPYFVQAAATVLVLAASFRSPARRADGLSATRRVSVPLAPSTLFRHIVLVAPWVFVFPSLAFVVLPALFDAGNPASPPFIGAMAAITLFTGGAAARAATRAPVDGVAVGLVGGGLGLLLGAIAVVARSRVAALGAGVPLGVGYGWTMTRTFRFVATRADARSRGALVGLTYALCYAGFGAPFVFVYASSAIGATGALVAFATLAIATAGLESLADATP